jgi:hypothetical protein
LRLQHHALAAAKWPVVNGAVPIAGEAAQIMRSNIDEPSGSSAAENPVLKAASEEIGKDRYDVESHE